MIRRKVSIITQTISRALFGIFLTTTLLFSHSSFAAQETSKPILMIGASFVNGKTPIDDNISGPFGGFAVGYGSYLSLGDALVRTDQIDGFVINEAEAGATTFTRQTCDYTACFPLGWQGYDVQFQKALSRVTIRDQVGNIVGYNADYLFIGMSNDCQHSGAAGLPQLETSPCTLDELNAVVDRLRDLAQQATSLDITPVFNIMPDYNDLDMPLFKNAFGLTWVIDEASYNTLRDLIVSRIQSEVPETLFVDGWEHFKHIGDGVHPTYESSTLAAKRIAQAINQHSQ